VPATPQATLAVVVVFLGQASEVDDEEDVVVFMVVDGTVVVLQMLLLLLEVVVRTLVVVVKTLEVFEVDEAGVGVATPGTHWTAHTSVLISLTTWKRRHLQYQGF
jgi:hypothetical protein